MKNKEQINQEIKEVAKSEFTTHGCVIKSGIDKFYKYQGDNIHAFLLENKIEDILIKVESDLDMTTEEVLFLSLESYKHFVLGMSLNARMKNLEVGEYSYDFNSMTCKKVFKEPTVAEIMEMNRKALILEQEKMLDNAINKANELLNAKDKEIHGVNTEISRIESELNKINGKLLLLKSKNIIQITPSERAKNKAEITELESKSVVLLKDLQIFKEELRNLKNKKFYISEDINSLVEILENPNTDDFYNVEKIKDIYK